MGIKKFKNFNSVNESFRDDKSGMSLSDMMRHKASYRDGVACSLINIITNERGISEKAYSAYDAVMEEVDKFYDSNKEELDALISEFEEGGKRKDYCAERIYSDYFCK